MIDAVRAAEEETDREEEVMMQRELGGLKKTRERELERERELGLLKTQASFSEDLKSR